MPASRRRRPSRRVQRNRSVLAGVVVLLLALTAYGCTRGGDGATTANTTRVATSSPTPAPDPSPSPSAGAPSPVPSSPPASSTAAVGDRTPTGAPVTLAFGGDVHFEGGLRSRLATPATTFGPVSSVLSAADLAMVNLETAITTRGTPAAGKQFVFRAPPTAFAALRAAGIDVVTMANNHGEDYGPVGLADSLAAATAAGFPVVGIGVDADAAYAPYRRTVNGQRIAVIGATQVLDDTLIQAWTAGPDKPGLASAKQEEALLAAVRAARRDSDTVVVYVHWGTERQTCPNAAQLSLAPKLVAAGADVVVGSHAHVLLGAGTLDGAYVSYGLGNFLFYSGSGTSGVLTLTTRGHAVTNAAWTPVALSNSIPIPMTGAAAQQATAAWSALRSCTQLDPPPSP